VQRSQTSGYFSGRQRVPSLERVAESNRALCVSRVGGKCGVAASVRLLRHMADAWEGSGESLSGFLSGQRSHRVYGESHTASLSPLTT